MPGIGPNPLNFHTSQSADRAIDDHATSPALAVRFCSRHSPQPITDLIGQRSVRLS